MTYVDPKTGKRHDLQRRSQSKAHARDLLETLLRDIDPTEGQAPRNERKTVADLRGMRDAAASAPETDLNLRARYRNAPERNIFVALERC